MRFLTAAECHEWVEIHSPPPSKKSPEVHIEIPPNLSITERLCEALVDWIGFKADKLFRLVRWDNYPPTDLNLMMTFRRGIGQSSPIDAFPGFEVNGTRNFGEHYDDRTVADIETESTLFWMLTITASLSWSGSLFGSNQQDSFHVWDNVIVVKSDIKSRRAEVMRIAEGRNLGARELYP